MLFSFPLVLIVLLIGLVATGVTGSATGVLHQYFETGVDSRLIAGVPQPIRSDEWSVQTAWTISQVEQGLPPVNTSFSGGFDTTVQSDLPSTDWSVAFRPHLLGFLILPLDNSMALKWWLPGFALMAACFVFLVTMMPRRPLAAALLSVGFFYAPYFQWWYLPVAFWPATWSFVVMAAAVWMLRERALAPKVVLAVVAGYLTVTTAVGVYVPFIVPAALVAVAFVIGLMVHRDSRERETRFLSRLRAMVPLWAGGAAGLAVLSVWFVTRVDTIERFLSTIYPGQRFEETGAASKQSIIALFGAPFSEGLADVGGQPLASNTSEAASFFFIGFFLVVPMAWLALHRWRTTRNWDWLAVCLVVVLILMLAFILVPGWDGIAHLLFLDRTTATRMRMGLGILSIVLIAVCVARGDELWSAQARKVPRWVAILAVVLASATVGVVVRYLGVRNAPLLTENWAWAVIALLMVFATYCFGRRLILLGAVASCIAALIGGIGANPLYRGVYDLNDTKAMHAIKDVGSEEGAWVGVGASAVSNALLVQSGLHSYNGFQGAPSAEMWREIDPGSRFEENWNRLANISWVAGAGDPDPRNPVADQILLTFDSCNVFAQDYVAHVVSDQPLDQPCLAPTKVVTAPTTVYLYDVVPDR